MKSWPLTDEQVSTFDTMVSRARQAIEKEREDKRKRGLIDRIEFLQRLRDLYPDPAPVLLLEDVQATAHLMMDPKPGSASGYGILEKMFEADAERMSCAGGMEMEADLVAQINDPLFVISNFLTGSTLQ